MSTACRNCAPLLRRLVQRRRLCRLPQAVCAAPGLWTAPSLDQRLPGDPCRSRTYSTEAIQPPPLDGEAHYPEKIKTIVDQISGLTIAEVADLNKLLKQTLGIQDAPVMAMGTAAAPSPAQEEDEEEEVAKPKEKTQFTVKLVKFDEGSKVKLIKQIKALTSGMNLVQAKKFVESAPQVVRADIGKTEAEDIKKQMEEAGGTCEIE